MRVACAIALDMFGMRYAVIEEGLADGRTRIWCAGGWFLLAITVFLVATKVLLWVMSAQMAWVDGLQDAHPQLLAIILFLSLMFAFVPVMLFFLAPMVIWAFLVEISIGLLLLGFAAVFGYNNRSDLEVPRPLS